MNRYDITKDSRELDKMLQNKPDLITDLIIACCGVSRDNIKTFKTRVSARGYSLYCNGEQRHDKSWCCHWYSYDDSGHTSTEYFPNAIGFFRYLSAKMNRNVSPKQMLAKIQERLTEQNETPF